jgi:hypothetical protein
MPSCYHLKSSSGITQPWFDELLERLGSSLGEISFDHFVSFLESGAVVTNPHALILECFWRLIVESQQPELPTQALTPRNNLAAAAEVATETKATMPDAPKLHKEFCRYHFPSTRHQAPAVARRSVKEPLAEASEPFYPDVLTVLGFKV